MTNSRKRAKIAYVGGPDLSLRIPLIKRLRTAGFDVHAVGSDTQDAESFIKHDLPYHFWPLNRGFSVIADLKGLMALYYIFKREKFTLVHTFDTKPAVLGRLAARLARIPAIVGTIPGMGTIFSMESPSAKLFQLLYIQAQRVACKVSDITILQNFDDLDCFLKKRIVPQKKAIVIKGSGVDTNTFCPALCDEYDLNALRKELCLRQDRVNFFMISRLVRHKGVSEYIGAASLIKARMPGKAEFYLVGPLDDTIAAFPREVLRERANVVRYIGPRRDIPALLCLADVVVLPSYYREGIPRILLEAAAMEVPIITTLMPGCREVVENGSTGYTVAPRDSKALAAAMEIMINERARLAEMGRRARVKIIEEFSLDRVLAETVRLYNTLLCHDKESGLRSSLEL